MIILKAEIQLWYIFVRCGKKLGEDKRKNKLIKTVWGVGYTFNG